MRKTGKRSHLRGLPCLPRPPPPWDSISTLKSRYHIIEKLSLQHMQWNSLITQAINEFFWDLGEIQHGPVLGILYSKKPLMKKVLIAIKY